MRDYLEVTKTESFIRMLKSKGLEVIGLSGNELRNLYGNVAGYRDGDVIYYNRDLDPLTQRAVIGHEYNEGPEKSHSIIQKETESLFRDLGDYPALLRTLQIGERLPEKQMAMPSESIDKTINNYWTSFKNQLSNIIDETGLGYIFDLFTGNKKRDSILERVNKAIKEMNDYKDNRLKAILPEQT